MEKASPYTVTVEDVRALLTYNKATGILAWKRNRSRTAKAGDEAGTETATGTIVIGLYGRMYVASRIIWLYVTGGWPKGRLLFRDDDPANLRWNNLVERSSVLSGNHNAVYQRRYRKLRAIAMRQLLRDPNAAATFVAASSADQRAMLKRMTARIADEMIRNELDPADR